MPEWWTCILVLVMCSAAMGIVAVVSCAVAALMQWLADKITEWWWCK